MASRQQLQLPSSLPDQDIDTIIGLHQTLVDQLDAAAKEEEQLLEKERSTNAEIEEEKNAINTAKATDSLLDQIQTDQTETEATNVAFELHRLQETQTALKSQLEDVNAENIQTVETELKRLRREEASLKKETEETRLARANETSRLQQLEHICQACIAERVEAEDKTKDQRIELTKGSDEPKMIAKQISDIEKQSALLKKDIKRLEERAGDVQFSIDDTKRQRKEVDTMRRTIERDAEACTATIESNEQESRSTEEKLDLMKAQHHSLTTQRLEAEIDLKKSISNERHKKTVAGLEKKQLDAQKRSFVKKTIASDKAKNIIPQLKSNLQDIEATVATYEKQHLEMEAILDDRRQKLHKQRMGLMRHHSMSADVQNQLLASVDRVEEKEMQIEKERAEEKKLGKVITMMEAQRNLLRREASQRMEGVEEVKEQIQLQNHCKEDLEKLCCETNKRCREFGALHDTLQAERDSSASTIQSSKEVVTNLKTKVSALEEQLDQTKSESASKSAILEKEYDAHGNSLERRGILRAEKNRIRSLLREKKDHIERQQIQLGKLQTTASTLGREVKRLGDQNEKTATAQRLMAEQLEERNQELQRCYQRSSLYEDTLEQGEASINERNGYIRMLSLECADLRRTVEATKRTMPDVSLYKERISRFETDLLAERDQIEELNPNNSDRARPLEGDDLEVDALVARLEVLEHRLHLSQNKLLEKEVAMEEITARCEEMEVQHAKKREEVTPLIQELTASRGRANDLSRTLISLMSELRMYQKSNITLSEKKATLEQNLMESRKLMENGVPPSEEARRMRQSKESQKFATSRYRGRYNDENNEPIPKQPRPNAYVPIDEKNAVPFGANAAPFEASTASSGHMRHYRPPRILTIEELEQQQAIANEVCA